MTRVLTRHAAIRAFQHTALHSHTQRYALELWGELQTWLTLDQQAALRKAWLQHTCGAGSDALQAQCNELAVTLGPSGAS